MKRETMDLLEQGMKRIAAGVAERLRRDGRRWISASCSRRW